MKFFYTATTSTFLFLPSTLANAIQERKEMVYGFDGIAATANLNWVPCFDIFTCTKLEVPLDYKDVGAGTTHVSFIKWSSNPTSTNSTTQDILLNPGGPGISGIDFLRYSLEILKLALGTEHNFVGFDPRGVSNSGPKLSCFPNGEKETSKLYQDIGVPLDAKNPRSYGEVYARAAAFGEFCSKAHAAASDAAKYANTVATASDMLRYTELLAQSLGQDAKKSQLWYYGASYGSILGTTFAALFPDRVGRVVVDSVLDGEDYYQGKWLTNLDDADKAFEYFFQTCYDAGKDGKCAFWAKSPSAIKARLQAIFDDVSLNPIPVAGEIPDIMTISDLKAGLAKMPLQPLVTFPEFANIFVELEKRNATALANQLDIGYKSKACARNPPYSCPDTEPRYFIMCTDANQRNDLSTYDAWVKYANKLVKQSQYLGEVLAGGGAVYCRKLNIKSPDSQVFHGTPGANQTSNPMLFISTAVDPGSPLKAAEKMVKRFGGARLLVQDNVGHGSTSAGIVDCTFGHVRRYFRDASLPAAGTRCKVDLVPFQ